MATDKQNRKKKITPEKAAVWAERKLGKNLPEDIAKRHGKTRRTIDRYYADFDAFIKESPEYQDAATEIVKMLPKACNVYNRTMEAETIQQGNPDVTVATNVFKATGLLAERKIIDGNINLGNMSDDDITNHIRAIISNANESEGEDSQVDSGIEPSDG